MMHADFSRMRVQNYYFLIIIFLSSFGMHYYFLFFSFGSASVNSVRSFSRERWVCSLLTLDETSVVPKNSRRPCLPTGTVRQENQTKNNLVVKNTVIMRTFGLL